MVAPRPRKALLRSAKATGASTVAEDGGAAPTEGATASVVASNPATPPVASFVNVELSSTDALGDMAEIFT